MPLDARRVLPPLACSVSLVLACGGSGGSSVVAGSASPSEPASPASAPSSTPGPAAAPSAPGWVVLASESFDALDLPDAAWQPAQPAADDGPYGDEGVYFTSRGVHAPPGFRASTAFGAGSWLTADSYTRDATTPRRDLLSIVPDPANPANKVLRLASRTHTDATVIRTTEPLPERYRLSLRVGFARFGDGKPGLNGYAAPGLSPGPWRTDTDANSQNGFYWLAILDARPGPHNSTWIHHHRKVVVDSDNNYPAWTQIFDGQRLVTSGEHPVTLLAIDGRGPRTAEAGAPFIPFAGGAWLPSGTVAAVDAYLDDTWYAVSIERSGTTYTLEVSGRFRYGGDTTYRATIDAAQRCVWHYDRTPGEDASACADATPLPGLEGLPDVAAWPSGQTWPDWPMFGDPHENFYAGEVLYDDVKLEVWRP